jgi:hypothetical protein
MELRGKRRVRRLRLLVVFASMALGTARGVDARPAGWPPQGAPQGAPASNPATRPVGTIKTINGRTIVLTTDAKADVTIQVQDDARLVRIAPGQTDLKDAAPIQLQDLLPGDRILVRGKMAEDGKTVIAASVIAMKQTDIATKQAHERDEWQRHGVGGLVSAIDAASGTIKISTNALGVSKDVSVQITKQTVLRRYAPDSVKFDDAKPAAIEQIKVGDQLRARGTHSADGAELTADEVVSGTFRNITGMINGIDASTGTIAVMDLVAKKSITVRVTTDTQLRKLAPAMAQRIAMRLKGAPADAPAGSSAAGSPTKPAETSGGSQAGGQSGAGRTGGAGGASGAGGGDLQQALSRMPAATLTELQKGDAVMIVATEGTQEGGVTAITLLAGVEPLLQAAGASTILTPWTMGAAPAGDAAP